MIELTLIRHGQAQTGAKDEASYDLLSDLGHKQARWVGEYFQQASGFDHVISGGMKRQRQTAQSLGLADTRHNADARLNELDYFGLADSLQQSHALPFPTEQQSFATHLPQLLEVWKNDGVHDGLETYEAFRARILAALHDAAKLDGRVLLVTSTGVISTLAAIALGLDSYMKSKMFLTINHTSVHKFELHGQDLRLTQFGATPHLEQPDRMHAKTRV